MGLEFEDEEKIVKIHQMNYIDEVCDCFSKFKIPLNSLPIRKGSVYSKTQCPQTDLEVEEMSAYPYRSVLGCLSFIAEAIYLKGSKLSNSQIKTRTFSSE